jgi:predicted phage tail protein
MDPAVRVGAGIVPDAPTNLTSSVSRSGSGSSVFLSWRAPAAGAALSTYRIEAGSVPGASDLAAFNTASTSTFFSTTVSGRGTFYVRVRAVGVDGAGAPSNEVTLSLLDPGLPGAPFLFAPTVNGSAVTLEWFISTGGPAPTSYIIQASSTAGGPPNLANFATGNTVTSLTATGVPPGTYFVRILAANNAGIGPPSSERSFIVLGTTACTVPPSVPSNLVALVNGSSVTLGWSPSAAGQVTSYVIEAGSGIGRADLAVADTGSAAGTATFNGVAAGNYFVRVRAKNSCGVSSVSNEVVVAVR